MTTAQSVICSVENGLCKLTLNRPEKLNVLSLAAFDEINAYLDDLDYDEVGCLLLTGAGRSFCAGHDLEGLASGEESNAATERLENGVVERLATLPFPVIAAVRGHCYTGGLELVLSADLIVCADDAKFADTHSKFDLVPIWGLTQRLPRRVGMAKAKEMMFTARTYSGLEAAAMGLANFAVPEAELDQAVKILCEDVLKTSRRSNREVKKLLKDTDGMTLAAGNAWELHHSPGHGPGFEKVIQEFRAAAKKS